MTELTVHSVFAQKTAAIIEQWTSRVEKWPGDHTGHCNRYLEDLRTIRRRAYRTMTRTGDVAEMRQHERLGKLVQKEDHRIRKATARR